MEGMGLQVNMEQRDREIADKMKSRWKDSIKNITLGLMFNVMSFNFWGLQYILPVIGGGLLYLGFKELKEEDEIFKSGWYFSIINILIILINLVYAATPLNVKFENDVMIGLAFALFRLIFIFEFRSEIKRFLKKKNIMQKEDPILKLAIWDIAIIFLAIANLGEVIYIFILMITYYFYIFSKIYKLRYAFGSDYRYIKNEKEKYNKKIFGVYIFANIVVVLSCCIFSNHIILDSKVVTNKSNEKKRSELIKLGFPMEILEDIEDEDLDFIKYPTYIKNFYERLNFYDSVNEDLELNTIFIETKEKVTYVIEHFNWKTPKAFWKDEIEISSTASLGLVSGKLIYEKNGKEYISNMPDFKWNNFKNTDNLLYTSLEERIVGAINYPFKSKNNRGYICYGLNAREGTWNIGNLVNYIHYNNPIRLPYNETGSLKKAMFNEKQQQHYTLYTTELGRERN